MKTFIICTSPKGRSISDYFFYLAEGLHDRGHRVIIITDKNRPELLPPSTDSLIYLSWPSRRPVHFKDFVFFYKLCKKYRPDGVLGNFGSTNIVQMVAYICGVKNRMNYWHSAIEALKAEEKDSSALSNIFHNSRKRIILKRLATHILTNSEENRQGLHRFYKIPLTKIRIFHPLISDAFANSDLSEDRPHHITFVGRVEPFKGQEVLVREMPAIVKYFPDIKAFIIGAGSQIEFIRTLARELKVESSVVVTDGVKLPDVLNYMLSSKVHISASIQEGFGLVNVEALSAGTPIIVNNVGGIKEILQEGYNGFAFDPSVQGDLTEKVVKLLTGDWDRFSRNARQSFLDNFSLRQIPAQAERFETLLK